MFIKECIRKIYGENTDIDFQKIEKKESPRLSQKELLQDTNSGSMIEDIEMNDYNSSGCVANMGAITPKYKCGLRSDVMMRFVQKYLTVENLASEGLEAGIIMASFFPLTSLFSIVAIALASVSSITIILNLE
jgi:hypothetical protein